MLDLDWYSREVASLAFYPHANENVLASVMYPVLGLSGETAEVVQKVLRSDGVVSDEDVVAFTHEFGDVLWYITRSAAELGFSLSELMDEVDPDILEAAEEIVWLSWLDFVDSVLALVAAVGVVSERVKKAMRDDGGAGSSLTRPMSEERRLLVREDLVKVLTEFVVSCHLFGISVQEAGEANISKLVSRKDRGKLSGDGDFR